MQYILPKKICCTRNRSLFCNENQNHVGIDQNIIFEQVFTNEGGGYHLKYSVFIAPQSGVYVVSSAALNLANGEFITAIVHSGNIVTRMYRHGENGQFDQSSQTIVIKLNPGDEVAVQTIEVQTTGIAGALYSSFSGYLLWPQ